MIEIKEFLEINKIPFKKNIELKKITRKNSKVILSLYSTPKTTESFEQLIEYCLTKKIKFEVVGQMWNTYFRDSFKCDILISTIKLNKFIEKDNLLICETGCSLPVIANWAKKNLIKDFEGFSGIPATVGGAAINNAGSSNSEMSKVVKTVTVITEDNKKLTFSNSDLDYKTRQSKIKIGDIKAYVIQVSLDISSKDSKENIELNYKKYQEYRVKNIDGRNKSLGSVFVSTTLRPIYKRYKLNFICKAIVFRFLKIFISDITNRKDLNTRLIFLFLGYPRMAQHCDSFNRFVWKKNTSENDYFQYIYLMKKLSRNKAVLENQIKE